MSVNYRKYLDEDPFEESFGDMQQPPAQESAPVGSDMPQVSHAPDPDEPDYVTATRAMQLPRPRTGFESTPPDPEMMAATQQDSAARRDLGVSTGFQQMIAALGGIPAVKYDAGPSAVAGLQGQRGLRQRQAELDRQKQHDEMWTQLEREKLSDADAKLAAQREKDAAAKAAAEEAARLAAKKEGREGEKTAADIEAEKTRTVQEWAKIALEGKKVTAAAEKEKTLPAEQVAALADVDVAKNELDKLSSTFDRLDMGTTGAKAGATVTNTLGLQGTDAAEFNAAALRAMQAVGKILEGGKLAAGDEVKYRRMLIQPGDSAAVVRQKVDGLKAQLEDTRQQRLKTFGAAGYKTPQMGGGADQPKPVGGTTKVRFPNGKTYDVPPEKLKDAQARGGVPVGG